MPLDLSLPPARLPLFPSVDEIVRHFPAAFAVQVDLESVTGGVRLGLAGARLPEPPEARLLDRVLQVVPQMLLTSALLRVRGGRLRPEQARECLRALRLTIE